MNYRPIFIAGCDRSGTTLLGDLLGKSRWSVTTPESQFIHDMLIQLGLGSFRSPETAAAWLLEHFRYVAWNMPLNLRELADLIMLDRPRATIEHLITQYVRHTHPDKRGADVWIDHTPDNFRYHAMLKHVFPEARFIHIVRDGRAVCASIKPLDWGPNNAYMASRHWAARLQEAMAVELAEGDNCLRVRFEDLLSRPEDVIRRICGFIDLPFEAALLSGGGLVLPAFTRNQHRLIGKSLDASRAESWRSRLSAAEIRDFESYPLTHTLLGRLGYETRFKDPPHLSSLRILGRYCHEFVHNLLHRQRHRRMEACAVSAHRSALNRAWFRASAQPTLAVGHTEQTSIHN
jgi:hypothetical protein